MNIRSFIHSYYTINPMIFTKISIFIKYKVLLLLTTYTQVNILQKLTKPIQQWSTNYNAHKGIKPLQCISRPLRELQSHHAVIHSEQPLSRHLFLSHLWSPIEGAQCTVRDYPQLQSME